VAEDRTGAALVELANALTTNFTGFLREPSHFQLLRRVLQERVAGRTSVEIWSAASSTGEEPYSILFTALETLGPQAEVRVLATDISTRALAGVQEAVYPAERVDPLPIEWRQRYFLKGNGRWQGWLRVKPEYRQRVCFRRFNLVTDEPPTTKFPVIFCRNVMIYFDKPTQTRVVRRLAGALEPSGYLMIGHSESLAGVDHDLVYVEPAVYCAAVKGRRG
jgi:chemotaxis protein methyltransferase CheR